MATSSREVIIDYANKRKVEELIENLERDNLDKEFLRSLCLQQTYRIMHYLTNRPIGEV